MERVRAAWLAVVLALTAAAGAREVRAQSVTVSAPAGATLASATPTWQVRAAGFGAQLPLQVTLQVGLAPDFSSLAVDSTFTTSDTLLSITTSKPLPSEAQVWWRVRVRGTTGQLVESAPGGPRSVPTWLALNTPNSPSGNSFDIRRPLFVWRSAPVAAKVGPWGYDLEITSNGRAEVSVSGLRDTTYRPTVDLQANTSYRWNVRATLKGGESVRVYSQGSFVITDPPLPTNTVLYQNFPNPFPSPTAFSTCFWFDVGSPGARISLEVRDLRGNLVRTIVPGSDGTSQFEAGRYGRGAPGASSNCDNRYVWDGTANDGRTVAPGVYLARFSANNGSPTFRKIVFRGR